MIFDEQEYLSHYGTPRQSGRYPWGSGGDETNTRSKSFSDHVSELRKQGVKETDIAKGFGISTTELRARITLDKNERKQAQILQAQQLKDKGYSNVAAAARMGVPESTFRSLIEPGAKDRTDILTKTSEILKKEVDTKGFIDVGKGVESHLGISKEKLGAAVALLREKGYEVHRFNAKQVATGFDTKMKALGPPGSTQKDAWLNRNNIQQIATVSSDGGRTWNRVDHPPLTIDPKRVKVRYDDEGGGDADGVIYVRPGVEDLSLGKSRYAQVRVKVGDGHYLKGMAMYKEGLPEGTDLLFNTNKKDTGNKLDALKPLTDDPDYPFGSVVNQIVLDKGSPKERVTSAMNIVNEEGQWNKWSRNISAQALSKQTPSLAKAQLDKTFAARKQEYDEILALTNPVVRKKLLTTFSDSTDSSAVHLKAAALERQNWHVILPIDSIKPTEIYAPNYNNGERVVLIRYPHGGTFEIPELRVNNKQVEARKLLGDVKDAVGIHSSVAKRLSGADFDGDTVLVIPNDKGKIKTSPALEGLKDFDPVALYKNPEGVTFKGNKQQLMGDVSNLITDMTIKGAPHNEIAAAVRHSMVVIDAEKHNLNYKQSAINNGIPNLKTKYQGRPRAGASTLISKATSAEFVLDRKGRPQPLGGPIDRATGKRVFVDTGKTKLKRTVDKKTNEVTITKTPVLLRSKKLAETDNAHTLSSGTVMEKYYADHSNRLKNLANQARLSLINTPSLKYSPSAKKIYSKEVSSLNSKVALANKNKPLERQAQIIANQIIAAKRAANPGLESDSLKKVKFQAQEEARARMGVRRELVKITPDEWNAIQAGAITGNKLEQILNVADLDVVRQLATPRPDRVMTRSKTAKALAMLASGATRAEVASVLGVSVSTLDLATTGDAEDDNDV